jgi:anti-sigma28 factor (negative regulator of flagellin synthesis)
VNERKILVMTIERIDFPEPISRIKKTHKSISSKKSERTDSIQVSEDAKSKAELFQVTETVKLVPDLRLAKIEEVKQKLQDPNYITKKVLEETAEKIMEYFEM